MGHLPDDVASWTMHCIDLECDGQFIEGEDKNTYTCEECGIRLTVGELDKHLEKEAENYVKFFGYE